MRRRPAAFTEPPLLPALLSFGIGLILFSVDYPYAPNTKGCECLNGISLSPADMAKLAYKKRIGC